MKYLLYIFVLCFSFQSVAKIAYVNVMKAFEDTKQGQAVKSRLETESQNAKKKIKTLEAQLKKEEESLKKEVALLSEQARMQKISQFQQKVLNLQKDIQNKDAELQKLQKKLMDPILERLRLLIGEIAKKESYQVVENIGSDILWVDPSLDLTKKIVRAYNKKYKK